MASNIQSKRKALTEEILRLGNVAYGPSKSPDTSREDIAALERLIENTSTLILLPILTSLVQPGRCQESLRISLTRILTLLPLRPKGVRNTIEFVLSIHPSTSAAGNAKETTASKGANVSLEALSSASKLISAPPRDMPPQAWFDGIGPQLLALLDGEGGLEMVKAASYIIGYGVLGRREYGAPGKAGWNVFANPLLQSINPSIGVMKGNENVTSHDDIIDLSRPRQLVSATQLADSLRRLATLLSSHPNPALSRRLLANLLLPLWTLFSWPAIEVQYEAWRAPAGYLLQIYLELAEATRLKHIMDNILSNGGAMKDNQYWLYREDVDTICIERISHKPTTDLELGLLDNKINTFVVLMQQTKQGAAVQELFLDLCREWLSRPTKSVEGQAPISKMLSNAAPVKLRRITTQDAFIQGKIIYTIMEQMPENLVGNSAQVLELVDNVLLSVVTSRVYDDSVISVALSLLNMVIVSRQYTRGEHATSIQSLQHSLKKLKEADIESSHTARNLELLLEYQKADISNDMAVNVEDSVTEDKRTYKLAMSYLTSTDAPPPVRAQGLDLLSKLIQINSPVLDIPTTLVLLASILQDEEEYIYLRSVKAHVLLSNKHPKTVVNGLVDSYVDVDELSSLDTRLRVGETLLQVIERAGQSFEGETAKLVGEALLSIAGRRGYRAKTDIRQQKEEVLNKAKAAEFGEAWDGISPIEHDIDNEALAQIVDNWAGKRGVEDVRIRASSLSIFGSALEYNICGISSTLVSNAIDLSVNILALESSPEKAILRRSAILLIMSLIRALDTATTKPGFGFAGQSLHDVVEILKYVMTTDNDGLVRQHAADVIEGLETWQMKSIFNNSTSFPIQQGELQGFGLSSAKVSRPRIEEVE